MRHSRAFERTPGTGWNSTASPEEDAIVDVLAQDSRGQYLIPFPVIFRDNRWWNVRTGEELDAFIAGWRRAANIQ
jgi:hypothetical protein